MDQDKNQESNEQLEEQLEEQTLKKYGEKDLRKYKDLSGISIREMNFGLWFSENRRKLSRTITIFLILLSAFFFIYSTYAYIIYFMSGPIDNQAENMVMSPRNVASEIKSGPVDSFRFADTYDLTTTLENVNDNFWAEFRYCFYEADKIVHCGQEFILPSEKKQVSAFGVSLNGAGALSFRIEDLFWSRVNRREIPSWEEFYNSRMDILISEIEFFNASRSGLSERLNLNSLEFTVNNRTPFGYYKVDLEIMLYSGSALIAIENYLVQDLLAEETRQVKMSWPGDMGQVSRVDITPRVNIMQESAYLRYR